MRACENHGVRQCLPHSRADGARERAVPARRALVSLYYDAPVATKQAIELQFRLDDNILRFNSMRQKSVVEASLVPEDEQPVERRCGRPA